MYGTFFEILHQNHRPAAPNFGVQIKFWWQTKTEIRNGTITWKKS
jgi:hypothetical protein